MRRLWLLALLLWATALAGHAQGVLPVPVLSGHVVDTTATLDGIALDSDADGRQPCGKHLENRA